MKFKNLKIIMVLCLVFICSMTGCKKTNVGAEEDNPIVAENPEQTEYIFGICFADMSNPYYKTLKTVIEKQIREEGHKMIVKDPASDSDKQLAQIQELIDEGVQAVILAPVDKDAITPGLELLQKSKVKIINIGTRVQEVEKVDAYVGADNRVAGKLCGEDLAERMKDGGKVLILEQTETASVNERILGFEEAIAGCGFEIVERAQVQSDLTSVSKKVKKILQKNREIQIVMCGDDQMALGALQAVEETKRQDTIIYGIGGSPEMKKELSKENSPVVATVGQSLADIGRSAVQVGIRMLNKEDYEEMIYEETFLIDKENITVYGVDGWN